MLPSPRSRMEPSPTCHCCSSCMDGIGEGRKGGWELGRTQQTLSLGESRWMEGLKNADAPIEYAAEGGVTWGQGSRQQGNCTQKQRVWDVEHRHDFSRSPGNWVGMAWSSARDWTLQRRGVVLNAGDPRGQSSGGVVGSCLYRAKVS